MSSVKLPQVLPELILLETPITQPNKGTAIFAERLLPLKAFPPALAYGGILFWLITLYTDTNNPAVNDPELVIV